MKIPIITDKPRAKIVDIAIGSTSMDLLVESIDDLVLTLKPSRQFSRSTKFIELAPQIGGRHFQVHIKTIKEATTLELLDSSKTKIEYELSDSILNRSPRTLFNASNVVANRWSVSIDKNSLKVIPKKNHSTPEVHSVSVFGATIEIRLESGAGKNFILTPRSRKLNSIEVMSDKHGIISISKETFSTKPLQTESILYNLSEASTGHRLRHFNCELGTPRNIFSYLPIRDRSSLQSLTIRPYWTTDGYLSIKVASKREF